MDGFRIYDNQETVVCFNAYRPLHRNNLNAFFEEITVSYYKTNIRYEILISSGRF